MTETSAAPDRVYDVYRDGVTTSDASARVQRVPIPVASPGACLLCGKSRHEDGFAFFNNVDFEFYGSLYFCADCVGDVANTFGWEHPQRVNAILAEHDIVIRENEILGEQIKVLESVVVSLTRHRDLSDNLANLTASVTVEQGEPETVKVAEQRSDVNSEPVTSEHASTEPVVSEPVDEPRPDDVPGATSDESASSSNDSKSGTTGGYLDVISELGLE